MFKSNKTYNPFFPLFFLNELTNDIKTKIIEKVFGLSSFQNYSSELEHSFTFFYQAYLQTFSYEITSERMVDYNFEPFFYGELSLDKYEYRTTKRSFKTDDYDSQIVGIQYFGARYYNSDISVWLSVDPMSDKYPSMSPYNYCAGNPVMLVDLDGREPNREQSCTINEFYAQFEANGVDRNNINEVYLFLKNNSSTALRNIYILKIMDGLI